MAGFPDKLMDYLMPAVIGAGIYFLQSIAVDVKEIAKTLAVEAEKIEQHERRITNIESLIQRPRHP